MHGYSLDQRRYLKQSLGGRGQFTLSWKATENTHWSLLQWRDTRFVCLFVYSGKMALVWLNSAALFYELLVNENTIPIGSLMISLCLKRKDLYTILIKDQTPIFPIYSPWCLISGVFLPLGDQTNTTLLYLYVRGTMGNCQEMHYHEQLFKLLPLAVLTRIGTPSGMYLYTRKGKLCFILVILDSLSSNFWLVELIFQTEIFSNDTHLIYTT